MRASAHRQNFLRHPCPSSVIRHSRRKGERGGMGGGGGRGGR